MGASSHFFMSIDEIKPMWEQPKIKNRASQKEARDNQKILTIKS